LAVAGAAGLFAAPRVFAQTAMRKVAILVTSTADDPDAQARVSGIRDGLRELGWNEGANIALDVQFGGGDAQRMRDYTTRFATEAPDVIVVNSTPALDAALKATKTIPIVFVLAVDPVALGHIQSVAHPGGNVTGFTFWDVTLIGKLLQLLKEAVPSVERASVLHSPDTTPFYPQIVEQARHALNLSPQMLEAAPIAGAAGIGRAIGDIAGTPGSSLILPSDPFLTIHRREIAAAALAAGLPSISIFRSFAEAGCLLSYGPDISNVFKRSAVYIDRILKGANPGDLPAQEPTTYEFTVNAGTARKLGLVLSSTLLATADKVID
jgi:putative ABC transport system substrate-binding protein